MQGEPGYVGTAATLLLNPLLLPAAEGSRVMHLAFSLWSMLCACIGEWDCCHFTSYVTKCYSAACVPEQEAYCSHAVDFAGIVVSSSCVCSIKGLQQLHAS